MPAKTNAMRLLDRRGIAYQAFEYDPEIHSAAEAASAYGAPVAHVYKTLVLLRDAGRPLILMVRGDREVDLPLLARSIGAKSVRMAPHGEAERLTGLRVGGIGALALLDRPFDVFIDRGAAELEHIYVNPGRRGINIRLRLADLVTLTGAVQVDATTA